MGRKYTYETTLDLGAVGELDVKVRFECPDHRMVEGVEVVQVEGGIPFSDDLAAEIIRQIEAFHDEDMILQAISDDAEARAEEQDRRNEARAERAGWRI